MMEVLCNARLRNSFGSRPFHSCGRLGGYQLTRKGAAVQFGRVGARSGVLRSKNDVLSARTARATAEITPGKFLGHTQLGLTFRARHDRKQANLNRGTSGGLQPRADSRFAVWGDVWAAGVVWARCPL